MAYGSATHPFASIHVRLWRNAIRELWPHGKHNKNAGGGEGICRFHPARATYRGVMTDLHDSWHKTPQSGDADSYGFRGYFSYLETHPEPSRLLMFFGPLPPGHA